MIGTSNEYRAPTTHGFVEKLEKYKLSLVE